MTIHGSPSSILQAFRRPGKVRKPRARSGKKAAKAEKKKRNPQKAAAKTRRTKIRPQQPPRSCGKQNSTEMITEEGANGSREGCGLGWKRLNTGQAA
jgi:hypothetical protein